MIRLNIDKIPTILKECFLFYSFQINNFIRTNEGKKKYNFNYTENSSLYSFSKLMKENKNHYLDIDWLFEYFNYQFCYWNFIKEQKEKQGEENYLIQLHWVLGKKALKRFDSKTQRDTYFYHSVFFPKYQIKKEDLIAYLEEKKLLEREEKKVKIKQEKYELNEKEENIKYQRLNTIEGFSNCLNFTTLFRFESLICNKCQYKKKCKSLLKINYPILYQRRMVKQLQSQI